MPSSPARKNPITAAAHASAQGSSGSRLCVWADVVWGMEQNRWKIFNLCTTCYGLSVRNATVGPTYNSDKHNFSYLYIWVFLCIINTTSQRHSGETVLTFLCFSPQTTKAQEAHCTNMSIIKIKKNKKRTSRTLKVKLEIEKIDRCQAKMERYQGSGRPKVKAKRKDAGAHSGTVKI